MLLGSAQFVDPSCGPCGPATFCSFGQCIPIGSGAGSPTGGPIIGPVGVIPPGTHQFGAPCPKNYRFLNNACVFTGSASHSFNKLELGMIFIMGILLNF